ncbi:MAG: hypothetical protein LBN32_00390 [Helicobacteraceae bacterium]|nr:hypothetical protein [Helicobacteraceae bacterium]
MRNAQGWTTEKVAGESWRYNDSQVFRLDLLMMDKEVIKPSDKKLWLDYVAYQDAINEPDEAEEGWVKAPAKADLDALDQKFVALAGGAFAGVIL